MIYELSLLANSSINLKRENLKTVRRTAVHLNGFHLYTSQYSMHAIMTLSLNVNGIMLLFSHLRVASIPPTTLSTLTQSLITFTYRTFVTLPLVIGYTASV